MSESAPSAAELKGHLKILNEKKGKLSRQIGQLKQSNQPIDSVLTEMKSISAKIKTTENELKRLKKQASLVNLDTPQTFPAHIVEKTCKSTKETQTEYTVRVTTEIDSERWNNYVSTHPASCIYHHFEFKAIVEKSFGHKAYYIAAFDTSDTVVGILPVIHTKSRIFGSYMTSIPYFNYGGPLSNNITIEQKLISFADNCAKQHGASHVEIRESNSREGTPSKTDKVSMFLALPSTSEQLWKDIGSKVRAQIKKGAKNNLSFKTGKHELLNDFYTVFSTNMRDLGTPVYSKAFFCNMLSSQLATTIAVQYHNGSPVSCAFLIGHNECLEIPWASTMRNANKLDANMVLYWNVLKFACDSGYTFFDFGRSSKDAPTFKFKRQWGCKPTQLHWHYLLPEGQTLPNLNPNNPKLKLVIWCWTKLPLFVANTLGPHLARSLP